MSSNENAMAEIRAGFFAECEELMESLQDGLQALVTDTGDGETLNVIFRAVHSIKGGAGAFGMADVTSFAHIFESALDHFRQTPDAQINTAVKTLLHAADTLQDLLEDVASDGEASNIDVSSIVAELQNLFDAQSLAAEQKAPTFTPVTASFPDLSDTPTRKIQIQFHPSSELYTTGNEPLFLLQALDDLARGITRCDLAELPEFADLKPHNAYLNWQVTLDTKIALTDIREVFEFADGLCKLDITAEDEQEKPQPSAPTLAIPPKPSGKVNATVRVDLERIDKLVNLVGELVINQSMLHQNVLEAKIPANAPLMVGLEDFIQLTREIQDSVMMIRAQPVRSLFQRMSRVVREAATSTKKEVTFITEGETTEIDKTVLERLTEPLTHILRNAMDHGLETPQQRKDVGKDISGKVTISAAHRSGRVVIEITDDGAGIDRDKTVARAIERGLIPAHSELTEAEIINLLFLPGFSTAPEVSQISGRGVGMDVVKTAIHDLGGRVTMTSQPGHGTQLSINLPLTLAVVDGMIIKVADQIMVVPLGSVDETLLLGPDNLRYVSPTEVLVRIQGQPIRILDLGETLKLRPPITDFEDRVALIVRLNAATRIAIAVDDIIDQRQVVIKGLRRTFGTLPGISAATILGDGKVALILDPFDLISPGQDDVKPLACAM